MSNRERKPRLIRGAAIASVVAVAVIASAASAATTEVKVADDEFISPSVTTSVGSSVHWSRAAGSDDDHNVRQNAGIFTSGAPTEGAIDLTVIFSAGTFNYMCEVHGSDMSGVVKVKPKLSAAPAGRNFTVKWATSTTDTGTKFDVQYRVGSSTTWKTWKSATTAKSAVFGAGGKPVRPAAGKKYTFRVRSRAGTKLSGWSPAAAFTA